MEKEKKMNKGGREIKGWRKGKDKGRKKEKIIDGMSRSRETAKEGNSESSVS